jgi:malate synthase
LRDSGHPGARRADEAASLIAALTHAEELRDFLTLPAYEHLS